VYTVYITALIVAYRPMITVIDLAMCQAYGHRRQEQNRRGL